MKNIMGIAVSVMAGLLSGYSQELSYRDITKYLSAREFGIIKDFILEKGDRRTYCNKYNHNPHYAFQGFSVYLHPEIGQLNINCDPAISDFDKMVIGISNNNIRYYHFVLRYPEAIDHFRVFPQLFKKADIKRVYLEKYSEHHPVDFAQIRSIIAQMKKEVNIQDQARKK